MWFAYVHALAKLQVANGGKPVTFASESTQTFQIEFQYEVVKAVMDRYFVLQASVSDNYVPAITSPPFRVVYGAVPGVCVNPPAVFLY